MVALCALPKTLDAQASRDSESHSQEPLSSEEVGETIDTLCQLIQRRYVFPEIAEQLIQMLRENHAAGKYDAYTGRKEFAKALTEQLRAVNNDKHLHVYVRSRSQQPSAQTSNNDYAEYYGRPVNYGFEEARILSGNVGYLKLSSFSMDHFFDEAAEAASAAMGFVGNSDCLIIDLRNNGGGSARLIQQFASYFYGEDSFRLFDYYFRTSDSRQEIWTQEVDATKRMPDKEVFILINGNTFSAAESFAYVLKHHNRATVYGQRSGGGAHGGSAQSLNDHLMVYIPFSRVIHPVTQTDWEGKGVIPDVEVDSDDALLVAQRDAIKSLSRRANDEAQTQLYAKVLVALDSQLNPIEIDPKRLQAFAGVYELGPEQRLTITKKGDQLFGQMSGDGQVVAVTPISQTRFRVEKHGVEFTFHLDESGKATGLTLHQGGGVTGRKIKLP